MFVSVGVSMAVMWNHDEEEENMDNFHPCLEATHV